jgi:hypothetical protein
LASLVAADAFAGELTRGSIETIPATVETENTRSYREGVWLGDLDSNQINGVRVLAASSCLPRLKPGTVLLREYEAERLTVTVVPTEYLWRETAYASLLQFGPPILKHISAIKTKLGTEP